MKLLRREKSWIHTFFVTDCTYLPDEGAREIRRAMGLVLEEQRIVFGIHFTSWESEPGLIICLECLPFPETRGGDREGTGAHHRPLPLPSPRHEGRDRAPGEAPHHGATLSATRSE